MAPTLTGQMRRHTAEQGYAFAGPVTIDLRPAPADTAVQFHIHSRIAPAKGRES
ncbi:hypothetical protein [Streptomyces sp. T12]|uniref:hypothetical protein n=1 Tax=Streptomyces sp. T12 TaxID=477697 RepID=UPI001648E942|nr:hypothetical protein [Streptomyces sp. T12]